MRLKPPSRKLLQILRARNQPLTRKHIPPEILRHLHRNLVLKIPSIDRSITRPHMARNDEVVMNPRNPIVAHGISRHRRNASAKRTLQILKLDNRHLRPSWRLKHRGLLKRRSTTRRHRSLRTCRNTRHKSQSQNQTPHHETHSIDHLRDIKPGAPCPDSRTWVFMSAISLPNANTFRTGCFLSFGRNAIHLPIHNQTLDAQDKMEP